MKPQDLAELTEWCNDQGFVTEILAILDRECDPQSYTEDFQDNGDPGARYEKFSWGYMIYSIGIEDEVSFLDLIRERQAQEIKDDRPGTYEPEPRGEPEGLISEGPYFPGIDKSGHVWEDGLIPDPEQLARKMEAISKKLP